MGLLDNLTGSSEEEDDEPVEDDPSEGWTTQHYTIKFSPPNSDGGWSTLENFEGLSYPMPESEFRANYPDPDPGIYRLWAIDEKNIHHPPKNDENVWAWHVEGEDDDQDDDRNEEIEALKSELSGLKDEIRANAQASQDSESQADPTEMLETGKAAIALKILEQDEFVEQFGADIALSALDVDRAGGGDADVPFDDYRNHPIAATMYQMFQNPERMEQMGQAFGGGAGAFLQGFTQTGNGDRAFEFDEDDSEPTEEAEPPEVEVEETDEDWTPRDLDAGPATVEDLSERDRERAESFARASTAEGPDPEEGLTAEEANEAAREAEESPADPIDTEPDDLGPDVAGADDEPDRCQAITNSGDRCKNDAQEGSNYCAHPDHGPDQDDGGADGDDSDDDTGDGMEADSDGSAATKSSDEPDPKEVVEAL